MNIDSVIARNLLATIRREIDDTSRLRWLMSTSMTGTRQVVARHTSIAIRRGITSAGIGAGKQQQSLLRWKSMTARTGMRSSTHGTCPTLRVLPCAITLPLDRLQQRLARFAPRQTTFARRLETREFALYQPMSNLNSAYGLTVWQFKESEARPDLR
jgi:hypothetical protein